MYIRILLFTVLFCSISYFSTGQNLQKKILAAEEYIVQNDFESAQELLMRVIRKDNGVHKAYYLLALCYKEQKKPLKALAEIEHALKLAKDEPIYHTTAGRILLSEDKIEQAAKHIQRAMLLDPDLPEGLWLRAEYYYESAEYEKALSDYLKLDKYVEGSPSVDFMIGSCYFALQQYSKAIIRFEKVKKLNPIDHQNLWLLGQSYYSDKKYSQAVKTLENLSEITEDRSQSLLLSDAYAQLGKWHLAEQHLLIYQGQVGKKDLIGMLAMIGIKEGSGAYKDALSHCDELLRLYPESDEFNVLKGRIIAKMGFYVKSTEYLQRAIYGMELDNRPFVHQAKMYLAINQYLSPEVQRPPGTMACDSLYPLYYYLISKGQENHPSDCEFNVPASADIQSSQNTLSIFYKALFTHEHSQTSSTEELLAQLISQTDNSSLFHHLAIIFKNSL